MIKKGLNLGLHSVITFVLLDFATKLSTLRAEVSGSCRTPQTPVSRPYCKFLNGCWKESTWGRTSKCRLAFWSRWPGPHLQTFSTPVAHVCPWLMNVNILTDSAPALHANWLSQPVALTSPLLFLHPAAFVLGTQCCGTLADSFCVVANGNVFWHVIQR